MATTVVYSPATLAGIGFQIETNDEAPAGVTHIRVVSQGAVLTAVGLRAVLSRFATYYGSTLSAVQVAALLVDINRPLFSASQRNAKFMVRSSDVATLIAGLATDIQTAGAAVAL